MIFVFVEWGRHTASRVARKVEPIAVSFKPSVAGRASRGVDDVVIVDDLGPPPDPRERSDQRGFRKEGR